MLPLIAIPVLHSSGAWIASTAASGYIAGTLSGTWVGAFILGNAGLLSSLGLVSAAGWIGASGAISTMAASSAATAGTALGAVGLGGFAQTLGLVPVTFLGLTPVGWLIAGTSAVTVGGIVTLAIKRSLKKINEERAAGGLEPTSLKGIINEVRKHEEASKLELLKRAAKGRPNWQISIDKETVSINDEEFPIKHTRFVVDRDKTPKFVVLGKLGRIIRTFRLDPKAI
ncbi:MAG: hypothetical protein AB8B60_17475 [Sulfitobacter sp.]